MESPRNWSSGSVKVVYTTSGEINHNALQAESTQAN